jgi:uncharacterized protein (DUF697 family)
MWKEWWSRARGWFRTPDREAELRPYLEQVRQNAPVPVFWLLGKTQSGKTTLVKYLTGAEDAEIGTGFQPCTRFSRLYQFPSPDAPLLTFLDTRGLDEPGYDPAEDLARFNDDAHLVIVTARVLDHAQENVRRHLATIRKARSGRPALLVLTCTHEAYPQQQHVLPYPFGPNATFGATLVAQPDAERTKDEVPRTKEEPEALPSSLPGLLVPLWRSIEEQRQRFGGLADRLEVVDITPPEEGFNESAYGGPLLRQAVMDLLPAAQAQTFRNLEEVLSELQDALLRRAMPTILAYTTLASTAGALPIPVVDLVLLSGLQSKMIYDLAQLYGQTLTAKRFLEVAGSLGLGMLVQQAARSAVKALPWVGTILGSVTGGVMGGASTYALGRAFCYYYQAVLEGHTPNADDLRHFYREQLDLAQRRLTLESTKDEGRRTKDEG